MGVDPHEVLATACIVEGHESKIVSLNSQREIRIYQEECRTQMFFVNISPDSYDFSIPLLFPQFYLNLWDKSAVFNGRDYCAYSTKEEAELYKQVELEVYTQFKVDQKDYTDQVLTESLNQNTFIQGKNIYKAFNQDFIA